MRRIGLLVVTVGLSAVPGLWADSLPAAADAQTSSAAPTPKYGRKVSMAVRLGPTGAVLNSYLRFDLSPLPADATVVKATLRLWVSRAMTPGTIEVAAVAGEWDERTITAGTSPALGPVSAVFEVASGDVSRFISVDVTELVQGWLGGAVANHGVVLRG